ncbi:MAG: TatD family hydrolase [Clostridia bacterium]|nr:TatD family hydrolase [Clostridia bacterium]
MNLYTDVHCHLTGGEYGDINGLIDDITSAGVGLVITAGFDIQSSVEGKNLAEKYQNVYFTAGFHPTELKKYRQGDLETIEELCRHPKCVALGETGLDYHYPDTDKPLQKEMFLKQLSLAHRLNMPVQIHSRDCAEDMLEILKANASLISQGALLHCYSHSAEMAREFEKLGVYFSFGGTSTYKGSKRARKAVAAIDIKRILTETDSPYLPPASKYGTFPNTPASIPEITANLADIKGMEEAAFAEIVRQNALRLFTKISQRGAA